MGDMDKLIRKNGKKGLKIILAEQIPSYNRGEAAILYGILNTFEKSGILIDDFSILSRSYVIDQRWYQKPVRVINWEKSLNKFELYKNMAQLVLAGLATRISKSFSKVLFDSDPWKSLIDADLVLVGHDNMLAGGSMWASFVCLFANLAKKPSVIIAGSIKKGKFGDTLNKYLLNNINLVTLRDNSSFDYCQSLNLRNKNIYLTADMAFLLEATPGTRADQLLNDTGISREKPLIGVTLSRDSSVFRNMFELYGDDCPIDEDERVQLHTKIFAEALDQVAENVDANFVFVPHCTGRKPAAPSDDRVIARMTQSLMRHQERAYLLEEELNVSDLKALISKLDLLIGERMHSVINALSTGVPALCISFPTDPRVGIISKMVGISTNIYDVRNLRVDTLVEKIMDSWNRRFETRDQLQIRIPYIKTEAFKTGEYIKRLVSRYIDNSEELDA